MPSPMPPRPCHPVPTQDDPRLVVGVGDRVRSYDFATAWRFAPPAFTALPGRQDATEHATGLCITGPHACYAEGVVVEITDPSDPDLPDHLRDCPRYRIAVERRIFSGERVADFAVEVFPPVNGTRTLLGRRMGSVHKIIDDSRILTP